MVFYVDLQPKDSVKCRFRSEVYAFLIAEKYMVVQASKPYSKIDTSAKTAVDVQETPAPPVINERTSWSYFKQLLNS